jgi:NAD(P)-dependent dehydrogenase (short-subunit alcohol dehydrogenase family)
MTSTPGPDGEPIMGRMASKAFQRCTMGELSSTPRVFIPDKTGRAGKPEEIAAPVLLLASRGGMYMNDTCIHIDGGRWLVSDYDLLRDSCGHTADLDLGHEGDF